MAQKRQVGVQIGRFAPYHKGHEMASDEMLDRHGVEDSLILVGSSNVPLNPRTPFLFEERRDLICGVLQDRAPEILPLPDIDPHKAQHSEDTIPQWVEQIRRMERSREARFVFYGGSVHDVRFFPEEDREVIVDRSTVGQGISGTEIRELLIDPIGNRARLEELMDPRIIDEAARIYNKNMGLIHGVFQ